MYAVAKIKAFLRVVSIFTVICTILKVVSCFFVVRVCNHQNS